MVPAGRGRLAGEKYRQLLALAARAFYRELDVVLMDAFLHLFFQTHVVETRDLQAHTALPDYKVRESLNLFERHKLIRKMSPKQRARALPAHAPGASPPRRGGLRRGGAPAA